MAVLTQTEALDGPSASLAWAQRLLPWAVSVVLVGLVAASQDLDAIARSFADASLLPYLLLLVVWASINLLFEGWFLHLSCLWLQGINRPWVVLSARAAAYLLTTVNVVAGYGGLVAFLKGRFGVPLSRGSVLILNEVLHEVGSMGILAVCFGLLFMGGPLPEGADAQLMGVVAFGWGCLGLYVFSVLLSRIGPRVGIPQSPLSLFEEIRLTHYGVFLAIKMVQNIIHGLWVGLAMICFGIDVPVLVSVALTQVIHLVRALPVSAFGIGIDQLTFPSLYGAWDGDGGATILAFSVAYTASILFARLALGVPFVRSVMSELEQHPHQDLESRHG